MTHNELTKAEYNEEIARTVDIIEEEYELEDGDVVMDAIWESVDSHEWIIYSGYHYDVLEVSDSEPEELMSYVDKDMSWQKIVQIAAFQVMDQDVTNEASERGLFD